MLVPRLSGRLLDRWHHSRVMRYVFQAKSCRWRRRIGSSQPDLSLAVGPGVLVTCGRPPPRMCSTNRVSVMVKRTLIGLGLLIGAGVLVATPPDTQAPVSNSSPPGVPAVLPPAVTGTTLPPFEESYRPIDVGPDPAPPARQQARPVLPPVPVPPPVARAPAASPAGTEAASPRLINGPPVVPARPTVPLAAARNRLAANEPVVAPVSPAAPPKPTVPQARQPKSPVVVERPSTVVAARPRVQPTPPSRSSDHARAQVANERAVTKGARVVATPRPTRTALYEVYRGERIYAAPEPRSAPAPRMQR